jgi:RNA polymerase sigma factor (sigma-70 family)
VVKPENLAPVAAWDETIKPLRLKVRICNNRLIRLREALGYTTAKAAALAIGIGIGEYCAFEAMSLSPVNPSGRWRPGASKIAAFHRVPEEFLWPEIALAVRKTSVAMEVDAAEAVAMLGGPVQVPEELVQANQDVDRVMDKLNELPVVIREVLHLRFGLTGKEPMTLDEVGEHIGKSRERVRSMESKGLRALREQFSRSRTRVERTMDAAEHKAGEIALALREEAGALLKAAREKDAQK